VSNLLKPAPPRKVPVRAGPRKIRNTRKPDRRRKRPTFFRRLSWESTSASATRPGPARLHEAFYSRPHDTGFRKALASRSKPQGGRGATRSPPSANSLFRVFFRSQGGPRGRSGQAGGLPDHARKPSWQASPEAAGGGGGGGKKCSPEKEISLLPVNVTPRPVSQNQSIPSSPGPQKAPGAPSPTPDLPGVFFFCPKPSRSPPSKKESVRAGRRRLKRPTSGGGAQAFDRAAEPRALKHAARRGPQPPDVEPAKPCPARPRRPLGTGPRGFHLGHPGPWTRSATTTKKKTFFGAEPSGNSRRPPLFPEGRETPERLQEKNTTLFFFLFFFSSAPTFPPKDHPRPPTPRGTSFLN